ncbi:hypothetical protein LEN26_003684 [Aphanomyces euteiches]|nr:hypothetical protein LEN26_003684 [Aphanomyces euteiches]
MPPVHRRLSWLHLGWLAVVWVAFVGAIDGHCDICDLDQSRFLVSNYNEYDRLEAFSSSRGTITTNSSALRIQIQKDGNFVLVDLIHNKPIWASMKFCRSMYSIFAIMQKDGNLVVYCKNRGKYPIWASQTSLQGTGPYCAALSDDPARYGLSVYDATCKLLWRSNVKPPSNS